MMPWPKSSVGIAITVVLWMVAIPEAASRTYSSWPVYNLSRTPVASGNDKCNRPPEALSCVTYSTVWYYSVLDGGCIPFSGCTDDTQNNVFETLDKCESSCIYTAGGKSAVDPNSVCLQPPDSGTCRARFQRWAYNHDMGACHKYVGCYGSGNNFDARDDCERTCLVYRSREPRCNAGKPTSMGRARLPRWTYNTRTGACEFFLFSGGSPSTFNHFNTEAACIIACL